MRSQTKRGKEALELVEKFKSIFSEKGYVFEDGDNEHNVITARDREAAIAGRFDDKLYLVYKESGEFVVTSYSVTSEPGWEYLKNPGKPNSDIRKKGAAILQPGQWYSYVIGKHRGAYDAYTQGGGTVTVWRDNNRDSNPDYENSGGVTETGWYGINIHKHSWDVSTIESRNAQSGIRRTSAGCTIFMYPDEFFSFMDIVKESARATGKRKFRYTLINKIELDKEPERVIPLSLYPPPPGSNTHRLMINATVRELPGNDAFPVKTLDVDDEVIMLQNHLGKDGAWALVKKESERFYVEKEAIETIEGSPLYEENVKETDKTIDPSISIIPWISQTVDVPYYDAHDGRHKVVIETEYQTMPEEQQDVLKQGFEKGAELLLKENNKKLDILEDILSPSGADRAIQATDFYLEDRAGAYIKVLVSSPDKNMAFFDDDDEDKQYYHEHEYRTEDFEKILDKLVGKIGTLEEQINNYEGKVSVFDVKREIENLEECKDEISSLFRKNDVSIKNVLDEKGYLKIGWNADMKPVFLQFMSEDQSKTIVAKKGLESFQKARSISSKRTQNFILKMEDSTSSGIEKPWKRFLKDYVEYEEVNITEPETEKKGREEKEGPTVKTLEELEKENNYYSNSNNKKAVKEKREKESDFVGSQFLDPKKFPKLAKQLKKSEEDLYSAFLNNVDVQGIMLGAARCLLNEQPIVGTIRNLKNDYDVLKKEYDDKYSKTTAKKELEYFYPDDFPTDDISSSFVKELRNSISTMVSAALNSLILSLVSSITSLCQDNVEDLDLTRESLPLPDFSGLKDRLQELFGEGRVSLDDLTNLLEDLSLLLSPGELCSLFEGEPNDKTLEIVSALLDRKYCHLGLKTEAQIIDFFAALALEIDFQGCRDFVSRTIPEALDDYICPVDNTLREGLLRDKGLSTEQVENMLAKERERSRKIVESFLRELKEGILSGTAQAPNMFCQKDKEGNVKEGTMPFMDESLKLTIGTMLQKLVEPTYSTFSKEGREYSLNFFSNVSKIETFPEPFGEQQVTIRKPLPQVENFYTSDKVVDGNDSSFSISLPVAANGEGLEDLLSNAGIDSGDVQDSLSDKCSTSARVQAQLSRTPMETITKVEYRELDACEVAGLGTPQPQPEEEVVFGNETVLNQEKEPACPEGDSEPATSFQGFVSPLDNSNNVVEDIFDRPGIEGIVEPESREIIVRECETAPEVGYFVKAGSREVLEKKKISNELVRLVEDSGYGTNYDSISFLKSSIRNSIVGVDIGNFSVDDFVRTTNLHQEIRGDILEFLFSRLGESPYLKPVLREVSGDGTTENEKNGAYIFDYVNLGPEPNEVCDPHLLKVKQLADQAMEDIENNFCLDLEADQATGGPRKTNVDSALIKTAVSLTLRYYVIEVLSTGILSLSTLQGADEISLIKKKYILERMKFQMEAYDENYYNDFVREAVDEFDGEKTDKTQEQILVEMIEKEYSEIKNGFFKAMLLEGKNIDIQKEYIKSLSVYERLDQESEIRRLARDKNKFVFIKDGINMTLCLSLPTNEYHTSGVSNTPNLPEPEEEEVTVDSGVTVPENVLFAAEAQAAIAEADQRREEREAFSEEDARIRIQQRIEEVQEEEQRRRESSFILRNRRVLTADYFFKAIISPVVGNGKYLIPISTKVITGQPAPTLTEEQRQIIETSQRVSFLEETPVQSLFEMAYPIDIYESVISIHEIEISSKQGDVSNAFGETRDELYTLFYATLPQTDDWQKTPKALETFGGTLGLTSIQDYNFGLKDTPCSDFSFNAGLDVCWGNPFKGLSMAFALKAARDTSLEMLKDYIEQNDPIIKLAKKLSFLSKLACVNVDTSTFSGILALSPTMVPTPLTATYNALGFGVYNSSDKLGSDSEEGERARRDVENNGLTLPQYCGAPIVRTLLPEEMTPDSELQEEEKRIRTLSAQLQLVDLVELEQERNDLFLVSAYFLAPQYAETAERLYRAGRYELLNSGYMNGLGEAKYNEITDRINELIEEIQQLNNQLSEIRARMEELGIQQLPRDPTPIELEQRTYSEEISDLTVDELQSLLFTISREAETIQNRMEGTLRNDDNYPSELAARTRDPRFLKEGTIQRAVYFNDEERLRRITEVEAPVIRARLSI